MCRASPKGAKVLSYRIVYEHVAISEIEQRGLRNSPVRFHPVDHSRQQIWKATTVLPVPVAKVSSTRGVPLRMASEARWIEMSW